MNRLWQVLLTLCLLTSQAYAQRAVILQMPSGQLLGVAYTPSGQVVLTDITIIKIDAPKPPLPVPPVTTGPVFTVVIRTVDTLTPDQSEVLSTLRQWSDDQPFSKVAHWEFPPDAVGPDGSADPKVKAFVSHIPAGKTQPYVFVCRANPSGKATILWHAELPPTADAIIAKITEVAK